MNIKVLVAMAIAGIFFGIFSVILYNQKVKAPPPLSVSYNPYEVGVYSTGIVESYQPNGSDVNIYPEVSGRVTKIFVKDGQSVKKNEPLLAIDDSVQRAIVEKDIASIRYAKENLLNVIQQLEKTKRAYNIDRQSISKLSLDNAIFAVKIARENVDVAIQQYNSDKALLDKYTQSVLNLGI